MHNDTAQKSIWFMGKRVFDLWAKVVQLWFHDNCKDRGLYNGETKRKTSLNIHKKHGSLEKDSTIKSK